MKLTFDVSQKEYEIVRDILQEILPAGCKVYVFGSRAKHTTRHNSDLDLALDAGAKLNESIIYQLKEAFTESLLPYMVDVLDMHAISDSFRQIVEGQKVLFPLPQAKTHNTPALRFPEFSGEWEEKRLGEIAERIIRKNTINSDNILTISAQHGLISQQEFFGKAISSKDVSNYYLLYENEFAYNKSYSNGYPMGAIKRLKKYKYGVVSTLYICFRIIYGYINFFEIYFESGLFNEEISKIAQEGARNHGLLNISVKDFFSNTKVLFPTLPEQQKIAAFLTAVDERLEALRRKKALQERFKRGVMQRIFSQTLRFTDAHGNPYPDWQEKKLGEIAERITQKNIHDEYNLVFTNSANLGVVSQIDFFEKDIANQNNLAGYYVIEENDFVYNPRISKSAPVGPIQRNKNKETGVMSPLYTIFRVKNQNIDFMDYFFQTNLWHEYIKSVANYGARHDRINITNSDFLALPIKLPSLPEQQRIADYLSGLDEAITATTRQIAATEQFKRALLQQMFV